MLLVREVLLEILVSLTPVITKDSWILVDTPDHQIFYSVRVDLYGKKRKTCFSRVILVLVWYFINIKVCSQNFNIFWVNILLKRSVIKLIKRARLGGGLKWTEFFLLKLFSDTILLLYKVLIDVVIDVVKL